MPVNRITPEARYTSTLITLNSANNDNDVTWSYIPPTTKLLVAFLCGSQTDSGSSLFDSGQYGFYVNEESFTHLVGGFQTNSRFDMAICYKVNPTIPSGGENVPVLFTLSSTLADGYMAYLIAFSEVDTATPFKSYNLISPTIGTAGTVGSMSGTVGEDFLLMVTADATGTGTTAGTVLETAGPSAKASGIYLRARGLVWESGTTASYADDLGSNAILAAVSINYLASSDTLVPPLLSGTQTFYGSTIAPGAVTLTPALLSNTVTILNPAVVLGAVTLTVPLIANTQTFPAHTVAPGAVALTPALFTNAQTWHAPSVVPGAFTLTPALFINGQTIPSATLSPGAVALTPALFTNTHTFYALGVIPGEVALTPALFTNTQNFSAPAVTPGEVALSPNLFSDEQDFFSPVAEVGDVTLTATMRVTNSSSVYAPLITLGDLSMEVPYTASQEEFYLPAVSVGDVDLAPQFLSNEQEFYELEAYIGALVLDPPFIEGVTEFFSCLVSEGGLPLVIPLLDNSYAVYIPAVASVGAILPEEVSGAVSVDLWTSSLDQGWAAVLINEGSLIGTVDQQLWIGEQPEESWTIAIEPGWSASINN